MHLVRAAGFVLLVTWTLEIAVMALFGLAAGLRRFKQPSSPFEERPKRGRRRGIVRSNRPVGRLVAPWLALALAAVCLGVGVVYEANETTPAPTSRGTVAAPSPTTSSGSSSTIPSTAARTGGVAPKVVAAEVAPASPTLAIGGGATATRSRLGATRTSTAPASPGTTTTGAPTTTTTTGAPTTTTTTGAPTTTTTTPATTTTSAPTSTTTTTVPHRKHRA